MRIVNKLTKPGDIRRVDLTPDTVRIQTSDGQERLYRASTTLAVECMYCYAPMGEKDGLGVSGVSHSICRQCWGIRFPGYEYPDGEPKPKEG